MDDLHREMWEGWTLQDFIDALSDKINMIMSGESWREPFKTKAQLTSYIVENQPYYKKPIPEVVEYFAEHYGLEA